MYSIIFHLRYKHTVSSLVSAINKQCIYPKCTLCVRFYCSRHSGGKLYRACTQDFIPKLSLSVTQFSSYSTSHSKLDLLNVNVKLRHGTGIYLAICHLAIQIHYSQSIYRGWSHTYYKYFYCLQVVSVFDWASREMIRNVGMERRDDRQRDVNQTCCNYIVGIISMVELVHCPPWYDLFTQTLHRNCTCCVDQNNHIKTK